MPQSSLFQYSVVNHMSAIETRTCIFHTEIELYRSTYFGFAQNTLPDFQNAVLNSTNATKNVFQYILHVTVIIYFNHYPDFHDHIFCLGLA